MKRKPFVVAAVLSLSLGCSTVYHQGFMRGQILESTNNEIYLCIGVKDGAKVGQELTVYNYKSIPGNPKSQQGFSFSKEKTGTVRITSIYDHYAKAAVISGKAEKHNVVVLER